MSIIALTCKCGCQQWFVLNFSIKCVECKTELYFKDSARDSIEGILKEAKK